MSRLKSTSYLFPVLIVISSLICIIAHDLIWMMIPFAILFIWLSIGKVHWIYFLLIASIPFSTEVDIPGGLSTDFPDEILMWWLCGIGSIYLLMNRVALRRLFYHPLTWMLFFHWLWILLCCLGSQDILVSIKFWLSKSWYLFIFYVLAYTLLKSERRFLIFTWISAIAASITVIFIESRHGMNGFAFNMINTVVRPFYRNHVNYACLQVCLLPYVWALWNNYQHRPLIKNIILGLAGIMILGIALSYTRAAYVALFSLAVIYPILKFKLVNKVALFIVIGSIFSMIYLYQHNRFLELAPDYNQAISHTDFSSLLAATPKGKDISTMERLHRWVAGTRMIGDKYIIGFGPNQFYNYYKPYTLNQFATYVSNNPDRSTIHNYFLMTAVEQGIPGLLIFLGIILVYFKQAQQSFVTMVSKYRPWMIASIWSLSSILVILCFNDMIETDKVGSYFFINLAILVNVIDLNNLEPKLT